jgi:hypothetical protein
MSIRNPVIAITGSSGAGTTSVTRAFQHIFRREQLNAAIIEGDSFHRYDRLAMRARWPRGASPATTISATSDPKPICWLNSKDCSANTARAVGQGAVTTFTTMPKPSSMVRHREPSPSGANCRRHRPAVLRRAAWRGEDRQRRCRPLRRPVYRRRADHQPRMDPETPSRQGPARLLDRSGDGYHPAPNAGLHQLHLPAVLQDARQFPARADGRHLQSLHRRGYSLAGREHAGDSLRQSQGNRLRLPAEYAA